MADGNIKWQTENTENPLLSMPRLYSAALDSFSKMSYGEASLNEIIKAAGLNKGSFYYRFYDKTDLYLSLLHIVGIKKQALFKEFDIKNPNEDFFESLHKKAEIGIKLALSEPKFAALWQRIMAEDVIIKNKIQEVFGSLTYDILHDMIEDAKLKGTVSDRYPTKLLSAIFSTVLERVDTIISPDACEEEIILCVNDLIDIMKNGAGTTGEIRN